MDASIHTQARGLRRDRSVTEQRIERAVVRRVLGYAAPVRARVAAFVGIVMVTATVAVLPPLLLKQIIDDGVLAGDTGRVVTLSLVVAGLAVVAAALTLVQRWLSASIGEGLIFRLRTEVFDHVLAMPVAFFTRAQTGKLVSRLNTDVVGAQQAFTSTLQSLVSNVLSLVLVLAAMLTLSWPLTLAALVLLPLFLIPARLVGARLAALTRRQLQLNAEMAEIMTERFGVGGALLIKLFGRPAVEQARFADAAGQVRDTSVRAAMSGRFLVASLTLLAALATAMVYGVGGTLAIRGSVTVGTLTALAGLLTQLYGPLTQLTNLRVDVMSALVSFERVFEVLDLPVAIRDRPGALEASGPASVEFDDVRFAYPDPVGDLAGLVAVEQEDASADDAEVLHGVSWRAEPGQTVALVGRSGSGKTTMTHLIARLHDVTGGAVRVGEQDVRDVTLASLQSRVGYVTQDAHLFHDTVRANLALARPGASDDDMLAALEAARVRNLVERLPDGLSTVVGERGYRLSGGERQRLAIARLLLKSPPIVVLDEATAHLDSESEAAVQRALEAARRGRTSIVIAHRLSTIRHADLILVVDAGRVVERGRHEDLLAAGGLYADLHRTQFAD